MESGAPNAALNLKIVAMHEDRISEGVEDTIIRLSNLNIVLMDNKLIVPALRMLLEDDMLEYKALIVNLMMTGSTPGTMSRTSCAFTGNLISSLLPPSGVRSPSHTPAKSASLIVCVSVLSCWLHCSTPISEFQLIILLRLCPSARRAGH